MRENEGLRRALATASALTPAAPLEMDEVLYAANIALQERLRECEEVVDYYACTSNWELSFDSYGEDSGVGAVFEEDLSKVDNNPGDYFGGKRARAYRTKYPKETNNAQS